MYHIEEVSPRETRTSETWLATTHGSSAFALAIFLFSSVVALPGCSNSSSDDEAVDSAEHAVSRIHPPVPFLPGLEPLALAAPPNGMAVTVHDGLTQPLTFSYDAREPYFGTVFLFSTEPVVENGTVSNIEAACLGGVTDMAPTHRFDAAYATLDVDETTTSFFRCNPGNPIDRFSTDSKLVLKEADFPPGTIYWAVLGYDAHYRLTHSSALRALVIE